MKKELKEETLDIKKILVHWFHHYGTDIYTIEELNSFLKIIEKNKEKLLYLIYLCRESNLNANSFILQIIRLKKEKEISNIITNIELITNNEYKDIFLNEVDKMKNELIKSYKDSEENIHIYVQKNSY